MRLKVIKSTVSLDRKLPVLLITGDGKTLREDLAEFYSFKVPHESMCIGRSIQAIAGTANHYADVDAEEGMWVAENLKMQYPDKVNGSIIRHTMGTMRGFDVDWDLVGNPWPSDDVMWHGSTSLFAVLIGLELGYKRIVMAGCPLDSKGHWMYPDEVWGPKWTADTYQVWFEFAEDPRSVRVKSMSGYTKTLIGKPTETFFNGIY